MNREIFDTFSRLVYKKSGIFLKQGKEALVSARVGKRMRALNIHGYDDYLKYLKKDKSGQEIVHLLDAISTNVTSFFRESPHFDFIGKAVEEWYRQGQRRFRFWSAACSSGEEPYSLAITLLEAARTADLDIRILGTDINTRVLDHCRRGIYGEERLKPVSPTLLDRYFNVVKGSQPRSYKVKPAVANMVVFKRLNLSRPPFPMNGPLDAVFCRNVMIYFDGNVRSGLVAEACRLLKPGGYMMVGHAESLTGIARDLTVVKPSIYRKPD